MNIELVARVRQCPNLPSLPTVAVQVLDLAGKKDVDIAEIARTISRDPALSTKILRTVNSSFYARGHTVSTISHALVILGLQSVKTLVLSFSLVSALSKNKNKGFNHVQYWRRSLYSATSARAIAAKLNIVQQEEAFLASLLQDIGMLILDQVMGAEYGHLCEANKTHQDLIAAERKTLGLTHAEIGAILAEHWRLPPILTSTIGASHDASTVTDPNLKRLAEVVQLSGQCADVFVDENPAAALAKARSTLMGQFRIPEAECDKLMDSISTTTREVASLFEINIGPAADYETILKKANEALDEITLQSQMQATDLEQQNQILKQQATTDGLTGLNNRASFDQYLAKQLAASQLSGKPLSLLMLDIDKFKLVNDSFGHQAGDAVLVGVARILKSLARPTDMVARYGGEEMAVVLPNTARAEASAFAETLRRSVAAKPISGGTRAIPVTISIGVATTEKGSPLKTPAHLLKAADLGVYAAKQGGRNCVKVFATRPAA
jgi:diguanylate cyclase (GGDEF)-like protein